LGATSTVAADSRDLEFDNAVDAVWSQTNRTDPRSPNPGPDFAREVVRRTGIDPQCYCEAVSLALVVSVVAVQDIVSKLLEDPGSFIGTRQTVSNSRRPDH